MMQKNSSNINLCPCHSQKPYAACCKPYHEGALPENALLLMRSRYSAYALQLADYIIETTHPSALLPLAEWRQQILDFARQTRFEGLDILEFIDGERSATVTFRAHLRQGEKDTSFTEKSSFLKVDGRWLYHSVVKN